jgi:hypothetical protein
VDGVRGIENKNRSPAVYTPTPNIKYQCMLYDDHDDSPCGSLHGKENMREI